MWNDDWMRGRRAPYFFLEKEVPCARTPQFKLFPLNIYLNPHVLHCTRIVKGRRKIEQPGLHVRGPPWPLTVSSMGSINHRLIEVTIIWLHDLYYRRFRHESSSHGCYRVKIKAPYPYTVDRHQRRSQTSPGLGYWSYTRLLPPFLLPGDLLAAIVCKTPPFVIFWVIYRLKKRIHDVKLEVPELLALSYRDLAYI